MNLLNKDLANTNKVKIAQFATRIDNQKIKKELSLFQKAKTRSIILKKAAFMRDIKIKALEELGLPESAVKNEELYFMMISIMANIAVSSPTISIEI